jgi:hypothetical protein
VILEGIGKNQSNSEIALQLGVTTRIIISDIKKMQFNKDPELKQMYQKRDELTQADKKIFAHKQDTRFFGMTGMTIEEKMFQNMINFYRPEIKRVIDSKDESEAISKLSNKVRKTLKRNGIVINGRGKYKITLKAHDYLKIK